MLEKEELLNVVGGINITGSLISSIYKGISTIMDVGRSLGSAIRRAMEGSMCPL